MSRTKPDPSQARQPRVVLDGGTQGPAAAQAAAPAGRTIRHAHLYLTRLDPWSVMKSAFMLSIAIAIVLVVAVLILWTLLSVSGTLTSLSTTVNDIAGAGATNVDLAGLFSFGRVFSLVTMVALMEVVLVSALATLFAYLYNLSVALTGGLQLTLTEDN
jgi:hypothetical protein